MRRRAFCSAAACLALLLALMATAVTAAAPAPAPPPPSTKTLSECLAELRDKFPEAGGTAPTDALRRALAAAGSQLGAALLVSSAANASATGQNVTAEALGAAPFTAFLTVSDKFDVLAGDPAAAGPPPPGLSPAAARERELFQAFHAGLPRDKQAAWVLYNLIPQSLTADELGARKRVRTHLSQATGQDEYDLSFVLPDDFALGGALLVRDRLGQELRVLSSFRVCEGWVHTVNGLLWPGKSADPASIPDPVPGGRGAMAEGGLYAAPFAGGLPPALSGADPDRVAATAVAATGAALDAAVATIQGSINNGSAPGGNGTAAGLPPFPPPPLLRPGKKPGAPSSSNTAAGLDASPASRARTVGTIVGAVVGGLVFAGVVGALAATLFISSRRRGGGGGGGGGVEGRGGSGHLGHPHKRRRRGSSAGGGRGDNDDLDTAEKGGKVVGGGGGGGGGGGAPLDKQASMPPTPGTPGARARAVLARALRGGGGRGRADGGDDTAGSAGGAGRAAPVQQGAGTVDGSPGDGWGAAAGPRPRSAASPAAATASAAAAAEWEMDPADIEFCVDPATGGRWRLGSGGFGDVYRARYQGSTDVAVKLVAGASPREQARFANEVAILKALRHTNIVQFLGAALEPADAAARGGAAPTTAAAAAADDDADAPFAPFPRIMLVQEYMARGDLWRALAKDHATAGGGGPGAPPGGGGGRMFGWWRRGRGVALDVTRALVFMHSKRVLHCDIKTANVLLSRDGTAKLGDVGLARFLTRDATVMSRESTIEWAAPEMLAGKGVDAKSDVFSLGVVLWEVVTGDRPRLRQMRPIRVPEECPAEVAAIIDACRAPDPADRPTAREVYDALAAAPWAGPGGAGAGGGARRPAGPPPPPAAGGSLTAAAAAAAAPARPPGNSSNVAAASPFAGPAEQAGGAGQ